MAISDWSATPKARLTLSGAEPPLFDVAAQFHETLRDFALNVMRPIGIQLDKMSPGEVIAEGSPYWDFRKQYLDLDINLIGLGSGGGLCLRTQAGWRADFSAPERRLPPLFHMARKVEAARALTRRAAIQTKIATPLGIGIEKATYVMRDTWARKLAAGLSHHAELTDQTVLLAFGGGGSMGVLAVAEAAGIDKVLVPRLSAVFSAQGIGFSDIAHSADAKLESPTDEALRATLEALTQKVQCDTFSEGFELSECTLQAELLIDGALLPTDAGGAQLRRHGPAEFHRRTADRALGAGGGDSCGRRIIQAEPAGQHCGISVTGSSWICGTASRKWKSVWSARSSVWRTRRM